MTALNRVAMAAVLALTSGAAVAADCKNAGSFEKWLQEFRKEALAEGITASTLASAAQYLQFDRSIVARDRGQRFFSQGFLDFYGKLANKGREQRAKRQVELHRATFARSEKQYGVPAAVVTAFWALESDFGSGMGNLPVLRSLATLAY
ncbi:MAG: lytic murein transglycosylase, partial [Hyphomicrobiaceae bacterium]